MDIRFHVARNNLEAKGLYNEGDLVSNQERAVQREGMGNARIGGTCIRIGTSRQF